MNYKKLNINLKTNGKKKPLLFCFCLILGCTLTIDSSVFAQVTKATLFVRKSVSNIQLSGIKTNAIPGTTIKYLILYSNMCNFTAESTIILERFPANTTYTSQSFGTATGWTAQWSTNTNPDQSWGSINYTNTIPSKTSIKWVRWRKIQVSAAEKGTIFFEIIIN